jgi:ATP-dependent Clp endopeptidase proteolytic subunit ClpP
MSKKAWYSVRNLPNGNAEISVFDEIGADGVTACMFLDDLNRAPGSGIELLINSPGGIVTEATAMMAGMLMSGKTITATVMGIAASAASYLLLGAKKRVMPENTYQFLHKPGIAGLGGNAHDLRTAADHLDKVEASLVSAYVKRTGRTDTEIKALLEGDSYLTAQECLELGLCDEVVSAVPITARFDVGRLPLQVRQAFGTSATLALSDRIAQAAAAAGVSAYADILCSDAAITTPAQGDAAVAKAREIAAMCRHAGQADRARDMIKAGVSIEAAAKQLRDHIEAGEREAANERRRAACTVDSRAIYDRFNRRT